MKQVIIQFSTLEELLEFEFIVKPKDIVIDNIQFTISGSLTESETELAIAGYNGVIVDEHKAA
jgi:hypothetical protein